MKWQKMHDYTQIERFKHELCTIREISANNRISRVQNDQEKFVKFALIKHIDLLIGL